MTRLVFLGTGGGRFVTLMQERCTGGMYLEDRARINIDPGPGALLAMRKYGLDPTATDALLISHCHPDHYASAEMLIEGMVMGKKGRSGTLIAPRSVIKGGPKIGPAVSKYHLQKLQEVRTVQQGQEFNIGPMVGTATPSLHSDPDAVGFRLRTEHGDISYVADTEMREEVIAAHKGARVLILANTRPLHARIPNHLSTEDSGVIAQKVKPEVCILTHLGRKVLRDGPQKQAEWVKNRSGVNCLAARDGMAVLLGEELEFVLTQDVRGVEV
ncbi:MAG: MBL fold metallo-hydrolase [Candidatus Thermoplasmatota archaeon]|jgi:phosphoribosyl 1,2-cyclic phosphodiesterase|nr:MBL fold metallo-hydrolase [Candidatus Thermoplasmatota archaeon]